ncbi:hypothetical protein F5Y04DRAFT_283250 [Hypomontagnella monticulosa]|nr:hypothetical protein F5Y04DRAFT_283250 [Hypomontagnella monticulosa]
MSDYPSKSFIEHSRFKRRGELLRIAKERHVNLGLVVGLSWRANGHQTHVDYVGGLDTGKLQAKLAGLAGWGTKSDGLEPPAEKEEHLPSLRDALIDAAPLDLRLETAAERKRRSKGKHRDFAGILAQIDTDAIASFALDILQARYRLAPERGPPPLQLPRTYGPLYGSAHVFYTLDFREGTKWIVKIPTNGTPDTWDKMCAETLRTEALVLYMLRTETSIPVPEIIDADSSPHNEIHVPYLIMECIEGRTLDRVWFGEDGSGEDGNEGKLREKRMRILQNLAAAMLQLGKYEFERGGAPVFDGGGALVGVGPLRELDVQTMVWRWFRDEDCDKEPVYVDVGPFADTREMYTALLDMYPEDGEANAGVDKLLRLLINIIREPSALDPAAEGGKGKGKVKRGFVLTHPGLNMRDIIVSKDGDIKGILGWDGVRIAPRSLGNEAFPTWLVRDFNPFLWRWQPAPELWRLKDNDIGRPEGNRFEDAPWVLRELRDRYVKIIQELNKEAGGYAGAYEDADVYITKQSLLALSLDMAVRDPRCRAAILRRILEKCSSRFEVFDFDQVVEALGNNGHMDGYKLKCLERSFKELINRGYVRGAVVW